MIQVNDQGYPMIHGYRVVTMSHGRSRALALLENNVSEAGRTVRVRRFVPARRGGRLGIDAHWESWTQVDRETLRPAPLDHPQLAAAAAT